MSEYERQFWVRNKVPTGLPPLSSRRTTYHIPPRFSDESINKIKELRKQGLSLKQIAAEFCCSTSSISLILKKEANSLPKNA
jgi:hypothetical protein